MTAGGQLIEQYRNALANRIQLLFATPGSSALLHPEHQLLRANEILKIIDQQVGFHRCGIIVSNDVLHTGIRSIQAEQRKARTHDHQYNKQTKRNKLISSGSSCYAKAYFPLEIVFPLYRVRYRLLLR